MHNTAGAEYGRSAVLVFPWPGPEIPAGPKSARDVPRLDDMPGSGSQHLRCQRSMPTAMLRPVNSAKVAVCAHSFANASSFATASCTFPYTSQLE